MRRNRRRFIASLGVAAGAVALAFSAVMNGTAAPSKQQAALESGAPDAARETAAIDAGPSVAPWVTLNEEFAEPVSRVAGILIHPEIELPALPTPTEPDIPAPTVRTVVEYSFPFFPMRTRGLPAVSIDGERVAHVYGRTACCRVTGYTEIALYILDAKTGVERSKLLLWTVDDETRIPQEELGKKNKTAADKSWAAYDALLTRRLAAARAAIKGEWTTLGSLVVDDPDDGTQTLRGEDVAISIAKEPAFPPISIAQGGTTRSFPSAPFRLALRRCPTESMALMLQAGYALHGRTFAIIETQQGVAAPDGCEGTSMHLLAWK
ncbi:MAG: hypothetical protein FWD69_04415 [Polyangiaceae bacterium]|nr:hypothetical protein [Polyangiaceae bacterium]